MTFSGVFKLLFVGAVGGLLTTGGAIPNDEKIPGNRARIDLYGDPLPEGAVARLGTLRLRHNSPVYSLTFSPDGRTIASTCADGQIHLWDVNTGRETGQLGEARTVAEPFQWSERFVSFSPDGKTVAITREPMHGVELWNLATRTSTVLGGDVQSLFLAFSPSGKLLGEKTNGFLRLWYLPTHEVVHKLEDHQEPIGPPAYGLAFSPDGKLVASGGTDFVIRLWKFSGITLRELKGHKDNVTALAFSPDGKTLVSAGWDSTVRVWDVDSGKEIQQFKGHSGRVYSAVISPDGKTVCSGAIGRFTDFLHSRQQQGDQYANDGDDHQQLD